MKYNKTKYPNIFWYITLKGKRYYIRRGYYLNGEKKEATESGIKTIQEARLLLAEIERKIENNEFAYNKNLTVDEYWDIYVDNRLKAGVWSPDTYVERTNIFKNHISPKFGNKKMNAINRIEYENYINNLLNTNSRSTVKHIYDVFSIMLNHAVKNKMLDDNIIKFIDIGDSEIKPINKRRSMQEFKAWDKVARKMLDDYDYAMVRITYLGLRRSEVAGIKLGNITFNDKDCAVVKIDESRTRGRKDGGGLKTAYSERYVYLDFETSQLLKKAIDTSIKIAVCNDRILNKADFLFLGNDEKVKPSFVGKPIGSHYIYCLFKKINKNCDVHFTPHMMRHFFATQGQIAGVPIEHMAAALGHSNNYMTSQYTHIKDEVGENVTAAFMGSIK
ncbi:TPA: tyrosine-type recombinase/integrase [Streptococcus pyogenes]|nr:tyrosine-type recombinase/integrase [Streptococcus pyogenes]HER7676600.1 tyrosine-type recombinase/integrase [Streptococcus pyogenes]HER9144598.1 tyrosine-type recombinase/integrase [Streptococcus pyogenes]HES2322428.1 tyrosine-type recombinase/integrase [Streptococcus pyogenes]HES2792698.1 tyrosine-type recombinase/integrase [Streptococcus pyogenes]